MTLDACQQELAELKEACEELIAASAAREAAAQTALRQLRADLRAWHGRRCTRVLLKLDSVRNSAAPYGSLRGQMAGYAESAAHVAVGEVMSAVGAICRARSPRSHTLPASKHHTAEAVIPPAILRARAVPSVSVIIPIYNACRTDEQHLVDALKSVVTQLPRPHEVIVVDDGSTDGSVAVVHEFVAAHPEMDIRLASKANGGQSSARNRGASLATGEWLAFLDQDDMWAPARMSIIAPHLGDGVDLVYTDADTVDQDGRLLMSGIHAHYGFGGRHPKVRLEDALYEDAFIMPGVMTIRRSLFERIGGFDERLSGCEDDDLLIRALLAGQVQYLPTSTLLWRTYQQSYGHSERMVRSRLLFWRKLIDEHAQATGHEARARRISLRFVFALLSECSHRLETGGPLAAEYRRAALEVLSTLGPVDRECFALVEWAFQRRGHWAASARYWFLTGMEPAHPYALASDSEECPHSAIAPKAN
jgi:GT2 family glycosyltransferase